MQRTRTYITAASLTLAFTAVFACEARETSETLAAAQAPITDVTSDQVRTPVETDEAEPNTVRAILVRGVVMRFVPGSGPLQGARVCIESRCTVSDEDGRFELPLNSVRSKIRVAAHGHVPSVVPIDRSVSQEVVVQILSRDEAIAFAKLSDGRFDSKRGMVLAHLVDDEGFGVADAWVTVRDFAALGPVYTVDGVVPAPGLRGSSQSGIGGFLELPAGQQQIGVRHPRRSCNVTHLKRDDEDLYAVDVIGGTVTWLEVECSDARSASIH